MLQVLRYNDFKAARCSRQWHRVCTRAKPAARGRASLLWVSIRYARPLSGEANRPCHGCPSLCLRALCPTTRRYTKLGYAGNFEPNALIPTYIATSAKPTSTVSGSKDDIPDLDFFIGQEATVPRNNYNVDYPIREGIVSNWDNMEKYLQRCIYQHLRADPEEHYFLMVRSLLTRTGSVCRIVRACVRLSCPSSPCARAYSVPFLTRPPLPTRAIPSPPLPSPLLPSPPLPSHHPPPRRPSRR